MPRVDLRAFAYNYLRKRGLNKQLCEEAAVLPQDLAVAVWPHSSVLFADAFIDADGKENLASRKAKDVIRASADALLSVLRFRSWKTKWYLIDHLKLFGVHRWSQTNLDEYDVSVDVPVGSPERAGFGVEKFARSFNAPWMTPYHIEPSLLRRAIRDSTHDWFRSNDSYRDARKLKPLKEPDSRPLPRSVKAVIILSLVILGLKTGHHYYPDLVPFDVFDYVERVAGWIWSPFAFVWDLLVRFYYWLLLYVYNPLFRLLS